MHKLQVHISNNISRCSCIIPNKIEQNFRRTQSKSLQRKSLAIERNRTQNVCVSSMPERNRIIERTRFKPYNDCSFSALATEKWNPSVTFLLAVSSWRWNSCSRENRDYFGKATSKEIRRARESELIYYATIHWLSRNLENNQDDSQDDLELALNLKLKDFSLVNKHNLRYFDRIRKPNGRCDTPGKLRASTAIVSMSELFAFPGQLSTEISLLIIKLESLSKNFPKGGESAKFQPKI